MWIWVVRIKTVIWSISVDLLWLYTACWCLGASHQRRQYLIPRSVYLISIQWEIHVAYSWIFFLEFFWKCWIRQVSEWFKTCSLSPMNLIELRVYVILLFLVWLWTILFIFGRLIFCFVGQILSSCFWIMITSQVNCIDDWLQRSHIRTLNEFVCEVRAFFWNDERSSRNIPQFPWFSFRYFVCFRQYLNKSGILVCSSYRCFFRFLKCWSFSCAIFSLILRFSRICLM